MIDPLRTNPSPMAAQRLMQQNPIARPVLPTNASPVAAQRLAQQGAIGRPPAPVQMPIPANPALQAQRTALPRGFGTVIR